MLIYDSRPVYAASFALDRLLVYDRESLGATGSIWELYGNLIAPPHLGEEAEKLIPGANDARVKPTRNTWFAAA